jgi:hypothetical protein
MALGTALAHLTRLRNPEAHIGGRAQPRVSDHRDYQGIVGRRPRRPSASSRVTPSRPARTETFSRPASTT